MPFLQLSRVTFSYPRTMKPALREIDLVLDKDTVTAVIGPNGSGKTTLTKLMLGILPPTGGEVLLEGHSIAGYSLAEVGRRIGYVFQNPDLQLFCRTVAEEIGFGLVNQGCDSAAVQEKVAFYLDYFELAACRDAFPLYLSQGEKQRLALAAALANEPEFLILDEPTIGLDACRKKLLEEILNKVARLGRGMILVSHDAPFVDKMAERVVTMAGGRIQSDSGRKGNAADEA